MHTIIVIGASNVTLALPMLWNNLQQTEGPLRLIVIAVHGRSYGMPSTILGRRLPSITECGFWNIPFDPPLNRATTKTILTDVGNDILYGATAENIGDWVKTTLDRVTQFSSKVAMAQLPMASLRSLSDRRYRFFRRVLFPRCGLSLSEAMDVGDAVNEKLETLATEKDVAVIAPPIEWYGIDPIHIRKRCRPAAWERLLNTAHQDLGTASPVPRSESSQHGELPPDAASEFSNQLPGFRNSAQPNAGGTLTVERTETAQQHAAAQPHSLPQSFDMKNPWIGKRIRIWRHKPFRMWRKNVERVTDQPSVVVGNSELWLF